MQSSANTVEQYISEISEDKVGYFEKVRKSIIENTPEWFEEVMNYGMIWYIVPHSIYPSWYHCDPKLPLPFIWLADQKNSITIYHMWIYADEELKNRFEDEYKKSCKYKLDMWKSCIRFKKFDDIPYELIGELCTKITVSKYIEMYEKNLKNN
jgi:hypothetical protein